MAELSLSNPKVTINGTDVSDWVTNVQIDMDAQAQSASSRTGTVVRAGIRQDTVTLRLNQDHAASAPDVILEAILGTEVAFTYKAVDAATSATNPEYTGNVLVSKYSPVGNDIGTIVTASVDLPVDGSLTRAVV